MVYRDKGKRRPPPTPEEAKALGELYVSIFTDGSHCPNTLAWGTGHWIKFGYPATTLRGGDGGRGDYRDSNGVEIRGIQNAIEHCAAATSVRDKIVVISCDNLHACNTMTPVVKEFFKNLGARDAYIKHVKGHRGKDQPKYSVNGTCDAIAGWFMRRWRHAEKAEVGDCPYIPRPDVCPDREDCSVS